MTSPLRWVGWMAPAAWLLWAEPAVAARPLATFLRGASTVRRAKEDRMFMRYVASPWYVLFWAAGAICLLVGT